MPQSAGNEHSSAPGAPARKWPPLRVGTSLQKLRRLIERHVNSAWPLEMFSVLLSLSLPLVVWLTSKQASAEELN